MQNEFLILTGLSGAGRSTVAKALEDIGWYVVDNLPPKMLLPLARFLEAPDHSIDRLAVVIDVRGGELFSDLEAQLDVLASVNIHTSVVFLEADDATLVRRFEQVRRPHPLRAGGTLLESIEQERARLQSLRRRAEVVIDTTGMNVHQLTRRVIELFSADQLDAVSLTITSFGFKYGLPLDADMVADMRFLPNPFWVDSLRSSTGRDTPVSEYVLRQPGAATFLDAYEQVLRTVLAGYVQENKRHAMFAFGCTGGKHRSVAMAEAMAERLRAVNGVTVTVTHRDVGKE